LGFTFCYDLLSKTYAVAQHHLLKIIATFHEFFLPSSTAPALNNVDHLVTFHSGGCELYEEALSGVISRQEL
jgi:hypothetical protein